MVELANIAFTADEVKTAFRVVSTTEARNVQHAHLNDEVAQAEEQGETPYYPHIDERRADLHERASEDLDQVLTVLRKVSRYTEPAPLLSARELERVRMTITNFEFRYQVAGTDRELRDAAQRASDDLAVLIPILRKVADMPEVSR